jgi:hypothetical protein
LRALAESATVQLRDHDRHPHELTASNSHPLSPQYNQQLAWAQGQLRLYKPPAHPANTCPRPRTVRAIDRVPVNHTPRATIAPHPRFLSATRKPDPQQQYREGIQPILKVSGRPQPKVLDHFQDTPKPAAIYNTTWPQVYYYNPSRRRAHTLSL